MEQPTFFLLKFTAMPKLAQPLEPTGKSTFIKTVSFKIELVVGVISFQLSNMPKLYEGTSKNLSKFILLQRHTVKK